MEIASYVKFILIDETSLQQYLQGEFPDIEEIKRRLFLKGRERNRHMPDQYYRAEAEHSLGSFSSLTDLLTAGVSRLAGPLLAFDRNRIYIGHSCQNEWQELITYITPLFLQTAFLCERAPFYRNSDNLHAYFRDYLLPNTRFTALPSSRVLQLDELVAANKGLHDLHMHLNGAMETDVVWQDFLRAPAAIYKDLQDAYRKPKAREQLLQESPLLTPRKFVSLLRVARRLRRYFYDYLYDPESLPSEGKNDLLCRLIDLDNDERTGSYEHEFCTLLPADSDYPYMLSVEALMYVLILMEIRKRPNEALAGFFHFYLLILGLSHRLLVQQVHQKGFEQFQKHTLNGLRENSERKYRKRYLQMHGNDARNLRFLEGRFSPKDKEGKMVDFIANINKGWIEMKKEVALLDPGGSPPFLDPDLRLVAHFIKEADRKPDSQIRHKKLRYDIWKKSRVLADLLTRHPRYRQNVVAGDAAASEFDAPPEVFAPAFRHLRRKDIRHFTYHAGEDFYHVLCGLRAIYEAIVFCGLKSGDRIGHATATGISVSRWHAEVGDSIPMPKGEYLDSLLFAYHLILTCEIPSLMHRIPALSDKVERLCMEIYNENYTLSILEKAWLMRQLCPVHTFRCHRADASLLSVFNDEEWEFVTDSGLVNDRKTMEKDRSWQALYAYHNHDYRKAYESMIRVSLFEIFSPQELETLQLSLLAYMNQHEIIIETLPTSNVRIGFHRDFSSYHLLNWTAWQKEGKSIPPIVVGTDDTGIFATNIYNEYANIYCCLLKEKKLSHLEVMAIIRQIDEDSRVYRFE